jgi:hypothetical protein
MEHSKLPWELLTTSNNIVDAQGHYVNTVNRTNSELIVEACNNYEALKAENERLKEQVRTLQVIGGE